MEDVGLQSLETDLQNANAAIGDLIKALERLGRADVSSIPVGSLCWAIAQAIAEKPDRRFVLVAADLDSAYDLEANLRFFIESKSLPILVFAAADTSPLLDVAPDRKAEMQRMAALTQLATDHPWSVLIVPTVALSRRVPPRSAVATRQLTMNSDNNKTAMY